MAVERPTIADDDGSGMAGTIIDAAFVNRLLDYIDARVAEGQDAAKAAVAAKQCAESAAATAEGHARRAMRFDAAPDVLSPGMAAPPPPVHVAPAVQSDAPLCTYCGSFTVRAGSCYACHECGTTSGCG